ncbi:MAG: sugar transferase [Myxococcota bacterium]
MRFFDVLVAVTATIFLMPLFFILVILIRVMLGRPVLFRQKRAGYKGRIFELFKFRTMTNETDAEGNLLPDEQRLTRFGRFLRKSSLDELPQLWNIIKGDMGLVGPRPLHARYLPRYNERQAKRHDVRPGLTGWTQVLFRNNASWEQKLEQDAWYVENKNPWLDLKIVFKTVGKVLFAKNVNAAGSATAPEFSPTTQTHSPNPQATPNTQSPPTKQKREHTSSPHTT